MISLCPGIQGSPIDEFIWQFWVLFSLEILCSFYSVATLMIVMEKVNYILEICPKFSSDFCRVCLEPRVANSRTFPGFFNPSSYGLLTPTKCTVKFQLTSF